MKAKFFFVFALVGSAIYAGTGVASAGTPSAQKVLYVDSEKGDDAGDGSAARPFRTPARAKAAVRSFVNSGAEGGVAVELTGVFTGLKAPVLDLGKLDGGVSPSAPVVWRAGAKGALFTGACRLTEADFRPVSGAARERLKPAVRDKVYACDLAQFGVGELKPLPAKFGTWSEMELISSGRAMTIARYPDTGWLEISNVVDRGVAPKDLSKGEWEFGVRGGTFEYVGDEPRRWDVAKGVFVFGFWCYDWASDTLRLAKIDTEKRTFTTEGVHTYGIGKPGKWAKAKFTSIPRRTASRTSRSRSRRIRSCACGTRRTWFWRDWSSSTPRGRR